MKAVEERRVEIMDEIATAPDWDQVRYRQGYIQAMSDLVNLLPETFEETQ